MKCGLKEMRWNMNDEVGNVTAHCRLGSQNKWWGIYIYWCKTKADMWKVQK